MSEQGKATEIETQEAMARRIDRENVRIGEGCALFAIRARDAQIATWCEEHAAAAEREASARIRPVPRQFRCEGQASALRALAAILRGGA